MKNKIIGALLHLFSFVLVMAAFSIISGISFIDQKTTNPAVVYSPFFFLAESLFKTISLTQVNLLGNVIYVILAYLIYYPASYIFALIFDNIFSKYFFTKLSIFPKIKFFMKRIPYDKEQKNTKKSSSSIMTSNIEDVMITELMSIIGSVMGEDGYIDLQNKLSELGLVIVSHHTYHNNQDGIYRIYKKESRALFDVERGGKTPSYIASQSLIDIAISNSTTSDSIKKFMFVDFKYLQNFEVNNEVRFFADFFSGVIKDTLKSDPSFNEDDWGNRYQIKIPLL